MIDRRAQPARQAGRLPDAPPWRVLLAVPDPERQQALREAIAADPRMRVVGGVRTGRGAVAAAGRHRPDVALVAWRFPDAGGVMVAAEIKWLAGGTQVIVLAAGERPGDVMAVFGAGASGFVGAGAGAAEVLRAIVAVASGGTALSPELAGTCLRRAVAAAGGDITAARTDRRVAQRSA